MHGLTHPFNDAAASVQLPEEKGTWAFCYAPFLEASEISGAEGRRALLERIWEIDDAAPAKVQNPMRLPNGRVFYQ